MARTTVDVDEELLLRVMDRFPLETESEAVDLALHRLAVEPLGVEEARSLRGSGWDGDLEVVRSRQT